MLNLIMFCASFHRQRCRSRTTMLVILSAAKNPRIGLCLCLLFLLSLPARSTAQTLARIRATKSLRCATISETPEYSSTDDHGPRTAFDTDLCRAVAIAILGRKARITVTPYPDDVSASTALRAHKVDLIPTLTLDLTHSADSRVTFSPPVLYDGVGLLVPAAANLTRPGQLSDKKICFLAETQVEPSLRAWFTHEHLSFVPFPFNEEGEMEAAFVTGNCAALAGDLTRLAFVRLNFGPLASRYNFLAQDEPTQGLVQNSAQDPLQIAADPLAAASQSSDPAFANIVRWTLEVLLNTEGMGFTQHNAAARIHLIAASTNSSDDPALAILTGQTREIGSRLHLGNTWATYVVAATGNYGELFDRTLGVRSPLKLPRAQNRLADRYGLMLPLPLK
jgi:general L-amino acid transport system substrate-binding protein